jgi:queuine tRNA-ribosyltransferase
VVILFSITAQDRDSSARRGILSLPHGDIMTPVFMPVGTNGTIKALKNEDIEELGFRLILGNAYHLYLRPGTEIIKEFKGLHNFMSWKYNILTDSGGFQVFSLAHFRKIEEAGIYFRSHIDGSYHRLTPEKVIEIQTILGSDILMPLDVCTPPGCTQKEAEQAVDSTFEWAQKSYQAWKSTTEYESFLFGIIQGNFYKDLREKSVSQICSIDLPGYAIGGLSVGEAPEVYEDILAHTACLLPGEKPRYLMGVGTPEYILEAVQNGIDLFDCVYPTRIARNAMAFTSSGPLSLRRENMKSDTRPIDPGCGCYTCTRFSRAYLRHLFKTREINAAVFTTYHNLYFMEHFMKDMREAITRNSFLQFKKDFLSHYTGKTR